MVDLDINAEERRADFALPEGCPACGGEIDVRVSAEGGAHAYCANCHFLMRPQVGFSDKSLTIGFTAAAA